MTSSLRFEFRFVTRANSIECWNCEMPRSWVQGLLALWAVIIFCGSAALPTNAFAFGDTVVFRKCAPSKIGSAFYGQPKLLDHSDVVVHGRVVRLLRSSKAQNTSTPNESHLAVIDVDQAIGPAAAKIALPAKLILNVFNPEGTCNRLLKMGDAGFVSGELKPETKENRFPDLGKLDFLLVTPDPSRFLPE